MAPEVFKNDGYDTKVDVFSFALILQEVIGILSLTCLVYLLAQVEPFLYVDFEF